MLRKLENGVPTGPVLSNPPKSIGNIGCPTEQMCVDSGLYCFVENYDPETEKPSGVLDGNTELKINLSQQEIDDLTSAACSKKILEVKVEAKKRIIALLPMGEGSEYRDVEINKVARFCELLDKRIACVQTCMAESTPYSEPCSSGELQEISDSFDMWSGLNGIVAIRTASDQIEAELKVMTLSQLNALASDWISTHIKWP